jgi:hypothetical protein
MRSKLLTATIFLATLCAMTVVCTTVWQSFITDRLYHCTDAAGLDFLSPGGWVHDPITVAGVMRSLSMEEPDTIRRGWSVSGLWGLWWAFVAFSVGVSLVIARLPSLFFPAGSSSVTNDS